MKRFGPGKHLMRPMKEKDAFFSRLHLLIVMVKAAMKGYPIGKYRKKAAVENAAAVHKQVAHLDISFMGLDTETHLFRERVKLLCVMAAAMIGEDYPMGIHRREAMQENIRMIETYAFSHKKIELFDKVLKVA